MTGNARDPATGGSMTSKERVLAAFRRGGTLPDRVPIQFDLCRPLLETLGASQGIPIHYTDAWYEDLTYRISGNELRVAMGSDCVVVVVVSVVGGAVVV